MIKKIVIAVVALALIGALIYFGKNIINPKGSGKGEIKVTSQPATTVFINGENKGKIPQTVKVDPGEYTVKLVPDDETTTATFEQKITVNAGTQTYVNVSLGATSVSSGWEIVSLEQSKGSDTEIAIFSQTDASEVNVDGERKGTTPLSFADITDGSHEVKLAASGYAERAIPINVSKGYKLTISAQLPLTSGAPAASDSATTKPDEAKQMVTIKDTPTGWLRVRDDASTAGKEVGRVNPGEKYELVEEQEEWYKIAYKEGEEGWVSATYAEKVE